MFSKPPKGVWKKQAAIIRFAEEHPKDTVVCADNDCDLMNSDKLPGNLHLAIPTGGIKALSREDLIEIDKLE
ncbi:hypothetical protein RU87_GL001616 [Lactococcus plantarum]|uniref:Uncharacterized protein n=2 Tax=Pseudolactococcus plantarum TaxID=1365 RepID=A0A2A5RYS7_9LACT|nr:hypothetical protein RU87_GL001616 [Lactococcus plantarum]